MYTAATSQGLAPRRLLDVGREVGDFLHLAHFDDVAVQHGRALGPLDRFRSGFHLDHPVAAEHFLGLGERPVTLAALPPAKLTRAPLTGGCSPSSPSSTPALVSDSLYLVILATRSAGGAKSAAALSYPLGITSIMNRMVPSSLRFRVGTTCRMTDCGIHPDPARRRRRGSLPRTEAPPAPRLASRASRRWRPS